jgi:hypothetical protein
MNQLSERYPEDFAVGQTFGSGRRRIDGERALASAAEFDPQPFHLDEAAARYYNGVRTHRSLNKDAPVSRPLQLTGIIRSHPILGALHHHYVRV